MEVGPGHYIENTGPGELRLLEILKTGGFLIAGSFRAGLNCFLFLFFTDIFRDVSLNQVRFSQILQQF